MADLLLAAAWMAISLGAYLGNSSSLNIIQLVAISSIWLATWEIKREIKKLSK